jgi:hypothetical protein
MPVQTYQWNKRAVVEPPSGAPADRAAAVAVVEPPTGAEAALELPVVPPTPPVWAAPPPRPVVAVPRRRGVPTRGGLTAACVVALAVPLGLTFAVEGMAWRHPAGANGVLVGLVAACVAIGSILVGLLASELGSHRSVLRGLAAAGLSAVTVALSGLLVDAHPHKFGVHLGAAAAVAVVGPLIAFSLATFGRRD